MRLLCRSERDSYGRDGTLAGSVIALNSNSPIASTAIATRGSNYHLALNRLRFWPAMSHSHRERQMMRSTRVVQRDAQAREGVAATEFAIMLPLFLVLALGIIEMGRSLETSTTMYAALREAGRLATLDNSTVVPAGTTVNDKIIQDIRNFLTASGLPGDEVDISIEHAEGADEGATFDLSDPNNELKYFRLTADVEYSEISIFPFRFMAGQTLRSSLVFRMGQVQLIN